MISLPGYTLHNLLILHTDSAIYRGVCDADHTPVLIKAPTGTYPTPETLARQKHEYETVTGLTGKGIVQLRGQESYEQAFTTVFEDPGLSP